MRTKSKLAVCLAFTLGFLSPLSAITIWDNGVGASNIQSGWYSSEMRDWRVYDDFELTQTSIIESVWFQMGSTTGAVPGEFSFSIYDRNLLGTPGSLLSTITLSPGDFTATPNSINSHPWKTFYDIEFALAPGWTLGAGDYFVSFYGLGATDFRTPNVGSGNSFFQQQGSGTPHTRHYDTPFRLEGVIAQPGPSVPSGGPTVLMLGMGIAAIGFLRRGFRS